MASAEPPSTSSSCPNCPWSSLVAPPVSASPGPPTTTFGLLRPCLPPQNGQVEWGANRIGLQEDVPCPITADGFWQKKQKDSLDPDAIAEPPRPPPPRKHMDAPEGDFFPDHNPEHPPSEHKPEHKPDHNPEHKPDHKPENLPSEHNPEHRPSERNPERNPEHHHPSEHAPEPTRQQSRSRSWNEKGNRKRL